MSKSDVLITLIKEVVKNEVKQQVKEEIAKLFKSGKLKLSETPKTVNTPKTKVGGGPRLVNATGFGSAKQVSEDIPYDAIYEYDTEMYPKIPKKEYTKNAALNEILNQTKPFTAAERASGASPVSGMAMPVGSVLDSIQRESEEDWGTIRMNSSDLSTSSPNVNTNSEGASAVTKALTRDYSELVKRFK
jgi:hypothetical protein